MTKEQTMRARHRLAIGILCSSVAALTACSSASSSSSSSALASGGASSSASSPAAASSSGTIALGAIVSNLVPGTFADTQTGITAALKALNAKGGVDGKQLAVQYCQDQESPNGAAACATKFGTDASIVSTIGAITNFSASSDPVLGQYKLPSIGPLMYTPSDFTSPMVFPTDGASPASADTEPAMCFNVVKGNSIALGYIDVNAGAEAEALYTNTILPKFGKKLAGAVPIPITAADLSSQAAKLVQANASCLTLAVGGASATQLITSLKQQGYTGKIMVSSNALSPYQATAALGSAANGLILADTYNDINSPMAKLFDAQMTAAGSDPAKVSGFAFRAWFAVQVAVAALEKAKTTDRAGMLASLQTLNFNTQGALPGPLNYADRKPNPNVLNGSAPNLLYPAALAVEVENGKGVLLSSQWQYAFK
jgi:ABC-type branched-subunit amino acid transport system substrate-binding protein